MASLPRPEHDPQVVDALVGHAHPDPCRADLLRQARAALSLGSPFVHDVLATAARHLDRAPLLAARLADWPGDRAAAALALRLGAGFHALARSGTVPDLAALYARRGGDFDTPVIRALTQCDATLAASLDHPTQTNEVARSGALMAGLMTGASVHGYPVELLELGASAGLNLNLAHYAHCLGGTAAGDPASPVRIAPEWRGPSPRRGALVLSSASGVDLAPLDVTDPAACERLICYVWADCDDRIAQLCDALRLARSIPPRIDRGDASAWLARRLAAPQIPGTTRAVMHSMFWQYLPADRREAIRATLASAGAQADAQRPLIHLWLEWDAERRNVELCLKSWPGGNARRLALADPYGAWVDWQA